MRSDPRDEGERWLQQAKQDIDDARYNRDGARYYIPTRYPNSLPGGIPAEAFDSDDANKAIRQAQQIIDQVMQALM